MKETDFDLLSQYVDGELDSEQQLQLKQRLLQEPELNKLCQQMRGFDNNIRDVMPDFASEEMNDSLSALLTTPTSQPADNRFSWKTLLPYAASVAMMFFMMGAVFFGDVSNSDSGLDFDQNLLSSLQRNQTWSADESLKLVVVQSYLDHEQSLCREYYAKDAEHTEHGVSCFAGQEWQKRVFELEYNQSRDGYATAADTASVKGVEAFIQSNTSKALNEKEEARLLEKSAT